MSTETNVLQILSLGKSKKIKLSDEQIMREVRRRPKLIGELHRINHEYIIDDVDMEESCIDSTLRSGKRKMYQLSLPPITSDHIVSNSVGTNANLITFRKDLFSAKSEKRNVHASMNLLRNMPSTKSVRSTTEVFCTKKYKSLAENKYDLKLKPNIFENLDLGDIPVNIKNRIIDLTITSDVSEHSYSKFPVLLKKVDPKAVPPEIKAQTLLKSNMNLPPNCKIGQVVLKQSNSPLKVVSPKTHSVLDGKNKPGINLVNMNQELKESLRKSDISHKGHAVNSLVKLEEETIDTMGHETVMQSDMPTKIHFSGKSYVKQANEDRKNPNTKSEIHHSFRKVNSIQLPAPMNPSVAELNINNVSAQNHNISQVDISHNPKENFQYNTVEVRLSSLANVSQGGTLQQPTVLQDEVKSSTLHSIEATNNIDEIKPSTSNSTGVTNSIGEMKPSTLNIIGAAYNMDEMKPSTSNRVLNNIDKKKPKTSRNKGGEVYVSAEKKPKTSASIGTANNINLTKDISRCHDKQTNQELGLNSLEELQQFWEFLVELHDYNKQVIRSQKNKKRRYLFRIKKLQHDLKYNLGIELEDFEEEGNGSLVMSVKEVDSRAEDDNMSLKEVDLKAGEDNISVNRVDLKAEEDNMCVKEVATKAEDDNMSLKEVHLKAEEDSMSVNELDLKDEEDNMSMEKDKSGRKEDY